MGVQVCSSGGVTALLAGPNRPYSYLWHGDSELLRCSSSNWSGPTEIPSDVAWSESQYYPFIPAVRPPQVRRTPVALKYQTPGCCSLGFASQLSAVSPSSKSKAFRLQEEFCSRHAAEARGFRLEFSITIGQFAPICPARYAACLLHIPTDSPIFCQER